MQSLYDAWLSQPPLILGVRLRPFSLGHWLILEALDNSWLPDMPGPQTALDLAMLVNVCARSFDEAREWLWADNRDELKTTASDLAGVWPRLEDAAPLVEKYMRLSCAAPEFWRTPGETAGKCPACLGLAAAMMKLGKTEAEAWDTPFGCAVWLAAASNGRTDAMKTDEEIAALKALREASVEKASAD